MICKFCGNKYPQKCGKYGCPNCNGEGLGVPLTQTERDNKLKLENAKRGLKQVTVWVPQCKVSVLKNKAEQWRKEHKAKACK